MAKAKSKTSWQVKQRYNEKAYDKIYSTVPKGNKDALQVIADNCGEKVNEFVNIAIEQRIKREQPDAEYNFKYTEAKAAKTKQKDEPQ